VVQVTDVNRTGAGIVDEKLEVVVIPVADVDRAKEFYGDSFRIARQAGTELPV
jgi:predicted enzyme related to lactoylglutathione lyase